MQEQGGGEMAGAMADRGQGEVIGCSRERARV